MTQLRTIQEINEKIAKGQAVVMTAEEVLSLVAEHGVEETARRVDVVTTGTFGPMCSSVLFQCGAYDAAYACLSYLERCQCLCRLAAVDVYLGATEIPETDPANSNYPGV